MTRTAEPAPAAAPAGLRARLLDRAASRLMKLPRATGGWTVTRGLRVPMRDGVELVADHYAPTGPALGTLLIRGPYGRAAPFSLLFATVYAERGYHVLFQSVRGTYGSGDEFQPMFREVEDGADTVAWLRGQDWFGGRFATIGLSYLGFTQWALLADPPPELVASVVLVGPHDFSRATWGTGAFTLNDFLGWSDLVAHQEDGGGLRGVLRQATARKKLLPALAGLPLGDAGEALLSGRGRWYRDWVAHPDRTDPWWAPVQLDRALATDVPVLLIGGWQDLFLDQTLEQYRVLSQRGADVALTVGPWTHPQTLSKGGGVVTRESLDWLGEHLAGTGPRRRRQPVRAYVTGADEWRDLPAWPPATTEQSFVLQPGGGLGTTPPPAAARPVRFRHDPADPTPTIGGRLLDGKDGGYRDDTALAQRSDVAVFLTEPLTADLEVLGVPVVELVHGTDVPHVDVVVRLSEVDADDESRNVSDALVRLVPGDPGTTVEGGTVRLELDAVAHRFAAGSRLRLVVAGASHPRWSRNTGSGEPPVTASRTLVSLRTIAVAEGVSRLVLPTGSAGRPSASPST